MSLIGPLDKRLLVRRCKACQRRKIKCSLSVPCAYCARTDQPCEYPSAAGKEANSRAVVFTPFQTGPKAAQKGERVADQQVAVPVIPCHLEVWTDWSDRNISHFFNIFLTRNDFTGKPWSKVSDHLSAMMAQSRALKDVAIALAALDRSRMPHSISTTDQGISLRQKALSSYSLALQEVRTQLLFPSQLANGETILWVTFFLGLFELMIDSSEKNWEKHFLYGTLHLLRAQGPECCRSGRGRERFLALRIFEISRTLLYNEPTFLSDPKWTMLAQYLREESVEAWHPKEAMYDLMLSCSVLSLRVMSFLETSLPVDLEEGVALVAEGTSHRNLLAEWHQQVEQDFLGSQGSSIQFLKDRELALSMIYYHALSIFLSGIYDYHISCFPVPESSLPILSRTKVEHHLSSLLSLVKATLEGTPLSGVLLLFPLRVAAARSRIASDQKEVVHLLRIIGSKGFTISKFFEVAIQHLWQEKRPGKVIDYALDESTK